MNSRPLLAIIVKDLRLHFGNRRAMMITLAVPIAIASFFGYIFGGGAGQSKPTGVEIQVADLDQSDTSKKIVQKMSADTTLRVTTNSEPAVREAIRLGKAAVAVVFPRDFGEQAGGAFFRPGHRPEVVVLSDPSRRIESSMVQGIFLQHAMQVVSSRVFSPQTGRKYVREAITNLENSPFLQPGEARYDLLSNMLSSVDRWMAVASPAQNGPGAAGGGGGFAMPFEIKTEEAAQSGNAPRYNGYTHSFGGMSIQFIMMASIEWGLAVILERQRGLWRRLRAAPVSRGAVLAGRVASSAIIALFTLAASWAFCIFVFHGAVNGSWPAFILCNVAFALLAACLGLFVAAIGGTPEATRGIAIFVVLILVMLGGAWVPSFIFPAWLQKITVVVPTRWAVDAFDAMTWRGLGFDAAIAPALVLLAYAAAFGLAARRFFKWEGD